MATYKHVFHNVYLNEDDDWLYYKNVPSNPGDETNYVMLLTKYAQEYAIRFKLEIGTRPIPDPVLPDPLEPEPEPEPEEPVGG